LGSVVFERHSTTTWHEPCMPVKTAAPLPSLVVEAREQVLQNGRHL